MSDENQPTSKVDLLDWYNFPLDRLTHFRGSGRIVGSLAPGELISLQAWLSKVDNHWASADDELRKLYRAIHAKIEYDKSKHEAKTAPEFQVTSAARQNRRSCQSVGIDIPPAFLTEKSRSQIRENASETFPPPAPRPTASAAEQPEAVPEDDEVEETPQSYEEAQLPEIFRLQTRQDVIWQLQRVGPGSAQDSVLEMLEAADVVLTQATTFDQARRLSDFAETLRFCAKKLDMAQVVQDEAAVFAIRAEHRYNELILTARKRGEIATSTRGQLKGRKPTGEPNIVGSASGVPQRNPEKPPTLAQIGIDKTKAKRLHRWTGISSQELARRIKEKRDEGKLTKTAVLSAGGLPKTQLIPYQPLLAFLKDLQRHPESYDVKVMTGDPELVAVYSRNRAGLLAMVEGLDEILGVTPAIRRLQKEVATS
jgi:hypothetical protein